MSPTPRAAVALLVFNRPEFTRRTFQALAAARPPHLLIVADGPRPDHPDDAERVRETRAIVEQVDWPCEVQTRYAQANLGCRDNIATGLDWVFSQVEEAIILEDDTLPHPSFFPYCEALLDCYRDDAAVHHISGSTMFEPHEFTPSSYYFSRCYRVWGWATWASAWAHYDVGMRRWPQVRDTPWLEDLLGDPVEAGIVRSLFDAAHAGAVPTWDFQWVFSSWIAGGVSLATGVNLVTNIGYGELASHERSESHPNANRPTSPMDAPLRHPPSDDVLTAADHALWRRAYPTAFGDGTVRRRWRRRVPGASAVRRWT